MIKKFSPQKVGGRGGGGGEGSPFAPRALTALHRIKYGNPEAQNITQQSFPTTRPYCSIEFIESF